MTRQSPGPRSYRAARLLTVAVTALLLSRATTAAQAPDSRSLEVLRLDCIAGNARSDLTLFGNGTLRLREGEVGSEDFHLSELGRDVFDAYVRRLRAEALDDGLVPPPSVEGLWTQTCTLALEVPEGPSGSVAFSGFDSLSLPLSRVVSIARELVVVARTNTNIEGLDPDYLPVAGDVLLHRDGGRYRVGTMTSDGRGVELIGIEQPLTLYVALEALSELFLGVEERRWR